MNKHILLSILFIGHEIPPIIYNRRRDYNISRRLIKSFMCHFSSYLLLHQCGIKKSRLVSQLGQLCGEIKDVLPISLCFQLPWHRESADNYNSADKLTIKAEEHMSKVKERSILYIGLQTFLCASYSFSMMKRNALLTAELGTCGISSIMENDIFFQVNLTGGRLFK